MPKTETKIAQAFIIMQIGNVQLDKVCKDVIVPALTNCGLDPKRVDKHNQGALLKSEIIAFIETSEIIVADLTNERPNCYLEVGYAMGVAKFKNLILTAREDHAPTSPNYLSTGPRIHFDLAGYDILFWHPDRLEDFRIELELRVRRRQAILAPSLIAPIIFWDQAWVEDHRSKALTGLKRAELNGFTEVIFGISGSHPSKPLRELLDAVRSSQIQGSGWPIGVVLDREKHRPVPTPEGIVAEITISESMFGPHYDYWALKREGDFYLLRSLSEDSAVNSRPYLFFDTRIVEVTEILLFCARLYSRLDVPPDSVVSIDIQYGGMRDRILGPSSPRRVIHERRTSADSVESHVRAPLSRIETDLVNMVKELIAPLFEIFEFFELSDEVYRDIVNGFVKALGN